MYGKLKILLTCLVVLFPSLTLWAQDMPPPPAHAIILPDEIFVPEDPADWEEDEERFLLRRRTVEVVFGTDLHIASDFITMGDIFSEVLEIDVQDIADGFRFNFGANISPMSVNVNINDRPSAGGFGIVGIGLDIAHVSVTGNMALPGNVLTFQETTDELFGVGAAAFVDVGVPVLFYVRDFRVRVRPALFTTLFHARPGIVYSFGPTDGGQRLELDFNMNIFSALNLWELFDDDGSGNPGGIPARAFGGDISLDVQYPILPWLSAGVNITNIPFIPSNLNHFAQLRGNVFFDTSYIYLGDIMNDEGGLMDDVFGTSIEDVYFGTLANSQRILRPFTMLFYAEARPFYNLQFITFIPSLGFSINNLYPRLFALEGGLNARFDILNIGLNLPNVIMATVGINYNDRRWRNSLDFGFNLRVFELGLGISSQSPSFVGSFTGAGIGVGLTLKFGW